MSPSRKVIHVAGHRGMAGSAIVRRLEALGHDNLVLRTRDELNLLRQCDVEAFYRDEAIDCVYLAAARVGGIHANNTCPAQFIYENLMIECNVIHSAHAAGVDQLMFLGSSCIYPALAPQPMREDVLLSGDLEPTNEPYAIAKIAGVKLCESINRQYGRDYRCVMPTNLYGPCDKFHSEDSHVVPALMRRFHDAKKTGQDEVVVWGSGTPRREFLHVDDMAAACVHVMSLDSSTYRDQTLPMLSHINVGTGEDCTIWELANTIAKVVGYEGGISFDRNRPDGSPRKLLDVSRLNKLEWTSSISLEDGLRNTYEWFLANEGNLGGYDEQDS